MVPPMSFRSMMTVSVYVLRESLIVTINKYALSCLSPSSIMNIYLIQQTLQWTVMCWILVETFTIAYSILNLLKYIILVLVQYTPPSNYSFPGRAFGKGEKMRMRACNFSWFEGFKWAHYDKSKDVILCFTCTVAAKKGL